MTAYNKHLEYFKDIKKQLKNTKDTKAIRLIITQLMRYLDKNHLVDKDYLKHNALFLSCEVDQHKIQEQTAEILLSFLTMIYRIDYIDPNSDAFMIYYKNQMIETILYHLIKKIKYILRSVNNV